MTLNKYEMKTRYIIAVLSALVITGCTSIRNAERLYQSFDYVKAIPKYEKIAGQENKHTALAMTRLGDINRLSSHFEQSAEWYQKAIATNDVKPDVYLNYGQVLRSLGRYEEAIVQFDKYRQLNPADPRAKLYSEYCQLLLDKKEVVEIYDVVNVKGLNSTNSDFSPVIMNDQVVFASDRSSGTGARLYGWTGAYYLDLFKAGMPDFNDPEKDLNPTPELLSHDINMAYHDGPASFSKDSKTIYFTRVFRKMGEIDSSRFYTNKLKIFFSNSDGNQWSKPEPFYLNNDEYSVGHPAISHDGKTLYFVSDMPGGNGGTDIYSVEMVNEVWTNLKNLGTDINTFGNEMFPYIDSTGSLYFSSDGLPGLGSLDLFKSSYNEGKWTQPENLKEPVNSSADDFGFCKLQKDKALFSSNRNGGKGGDDIYMGSVIKYADSVLVSGLVKDRTTGELLTNTTVLVWNTQKDEVLILKTNEKGEYSTYLKPGASYVFKSVKQDYTTDCLTAKIPQFTREDKMKNRDLLLVKLQLEEKFKLENVFYDFDKWNIRPDAAAELNRLADFLNQNPGVSVELGSHTDCRGTHKYNERLAERRAASAVKYIVDKGISRKIITAKGYGETRLVNQCSDGIECNEQQHQDNRRTEVKIIGLTEESQGENYEPLEALKPGQVIKLTTLSKDFFNNCSEQQEI